MMLEDPTNTAAPSQSKARFESTAQAYLELLSLRGIEYFFANAGTDFASIVDAFAFRQHRGDNFPRPITVPHETPLISMAHGYYMLTGKPQAAMVHVGVGTANGLGALMAAQKARVPILFSAGRTPLTESGSPASRNAYIHWGQEAFDQAGMLREYVKWDYELRMPSQLEAVVDRALVMSMAEPRGPVYLTFPREILAAQYEGVEFQKQHRFDLPTFYPDPQKLREAVNLLIGAESPLIITSSVGRSPAAVRALVDLADVAGVGVVCFNPEYMNFPLDHSCHLGFSPDELIADADVILVVDCDVPWYPNKIVPRETTKIILAGIDPYYSGYPIRGFPSDLTLQGEPALVLLEITRILRDHPDLKAGTITSRKNNFQEIHNHMLKRFEKTASTAAQDSPIDTAWVSHSVNRILGENTVVVNEYDNAMKQQINLLPGNYFCTPPAGFLGWAVGAALGAKLADREKTVIATVGDGSYMFSVPSACHFVSAAYQLPILIIVYNNQSWHAVKRATLGVHPDGWAARTNRFPLSDLEPTARYEKICEAFGGYGERVEHPGQIQPALNRALNAVQNEKRQALLNIICKHP
ncbi:MAG: thiamine pyrophosphate-requiring protein [Desulfobacterales bacterium]